VGLGPGDLVLCSGTLRRDIGFKERVGAAASAGFDAISLWGRDYQRARHEGWSDADLRAILADHGLSVAEVDPHWSWLPGAAEVQLPKAFDVEEIFGFKEAELFAIADALGARSINAVDVLGGAWTLEEAAESFGELCDGALEHGLLVHLEFLPWSRLGDLATAWQIVQWADRPNGGLTIDAWHFFRAGADLVTLATVPGDKILAVQLDDAPDLAEDDLARASLHERLLPGDGAFDLRSLLRTLRSVGAVAPVGVEVFSDDLDALPAEVSAAQAARALRGALAASVTGP